MKAVFSVLALLLTVITSVRAEEKPVVTLVARLDDPRVDESSGLTSSLRNPELFWTLNDSGGGPFLFAFDQKGKTRARYEVQGSSNIDWEDLAAGKDEQGAASLYIGDIGDNLLIRPEIYIYRVPEPEVEAADAGIAERKTEPATVFRAIYPDGKHNAESLLVHPVTGRIYIITKSKEKLDATVLMKLESVGSFILPEMSHPGKKPDDNCLCTGAAFSPKGDKLVLCTYSNLYEWSLPDGIPFADALAAKPRRIQPPYIPQIEAVCYNAAGVIWFSSERAPMPLYRVEAK
jgi:hypothetical protein